MILVDNNLSYRVASYKKFVLDFTDNPKVYYIAASIYNELAENEKLQDKLMGLLPSIQPESGVLLFPTQPNGQLFTYACYQITNQDGHYQFQIGMGYKGGLDLFITGDTSEVVSSIVTVDPIFPASDIHNIIKGVRTMVLLTVLFKQYAPIESKILNNEKGKSNKIVLNKEKYLNNATCPVQIIDSTWFTTIIRTTGFSVKGHFGLRACGPGHSERKLTWISGYQKAGYRREAGRLRE